MMNWTSSRIAPYVLGGLSLALTACSGRQNQNAANGSAGSAPSAQQASLASARIDGARVATLADGPDVCFRAVTKLLGVNTKVAELTSFFSVGGEIDPTSTEPRGRMTTCTVNYQNPADPRKLLMTSMDVASGTFSPPNPVEITVMGDEAKFRLDNYLVPLSQVNAAALAATMKNQEPKLGSTYSRYAWSGVRLSAPDAFSSTHTLRLDVTGRLSANDIKKDGYASVTMDGKTIKTNFLTS